MKTPNLWQKLIAGFKKPVRSIQKKTDHIPKESDNFFRESGESIYHQKKKARKKWKLKKRIENRSRAINYQNI